MSALVPQPIEVLIARALAEHESKGAIFDLPRRSFWRGRAGMDLSCELPGGRVATPLGPAAGPHTQLAQNLVLAWLAGARTLELKTVQANDRLTIPRPCIDAPDVGYNVEWSQELRLDESTEQYATAWLLIHLLAARGVVGDSADAESPSFEVSVGYDLAGIRSAAVALFLDNLTDAEVLLGRLRDRLPPALRGGAEVGVPPRIANTVTLSTFHGCPPEEIERIVEHLFARHGVHVVIKLNPTLLGYDEVESLLRGRLGYEEITLDREAFTSDLQWPAALQLFERLEAASRRHNLGLGAKLTNTLVVRNERQRLAGENVFLSGPPLHPIAITLAARLAEATEGRIPLSFSGGIQAENFPAVVTCGFAPVTTCTDLLRPTGYRRLPRYLKALVSEMERLGAASLPELVSKWGGGQTSPARLDDDDAERLAALQNLRDYASQVVDDPAYQARGHRKEPVQQGMLELFDCSSCNNCVVVCPNDAFFALPGSPMALDTWELILEGGEIRNAPIRFEINREKQWAVFADLCNECGNCDTFCPERGGPFRVKPRFFGTRESFDRHPMTDGILLERDGAGLTARLSGVAYEVVWSGDQARFSDGVLEATLDAEGGLISTRILNRGEGHRLSLWPFHALRLLRQAVLAGVNPVSAPLLPPLNR
jgi:putative selenate reductase